MMDKQIIECVYCGSEIEWNQKLFEEGTYGEPVCDVCIEGDSK